MNDCFVYIKFDLVIIEIWYNENKRTRENLLTIDEQQNYWVIKLRDNII